jgi:HMG-box domain
MEPMNHSHRSSSPSSWKGEEVKVTVPSSSSALSSCPSNPYQFDIDEATPIEKMLNNPTGAPVFRAPDAALPAAPSHMQSKKQVDSSYPCDPSEDKAKDKPKRPLSAYNIFFKFQRKRILAIMPVRDSGKPRRSHGKMGFADMARAVASQWKAISPQEKAAYAELAAVDKRRYKDELEVWKKFMASEEHRLVGTSACAMVTDMREWLLVPTITTAVSSNGEHRHSTTTNHPQVPSHVMLMGTMRGLDVNGFNPMSADGLKLLWSNNMASSPPPPSQQHKANHGGEEQFKLGSTHALAPPTTSHRLSMMHHSPFFRMANLDAASAVGEHLFQGFPPCLVYTPPPAAAAAAASSTGNAAAADNEISNLATNLGRDGCEFMVELFRNT